MDAHRLMMKGFDLSFDQANALERKIEACPDDFASLCLLLSYYFTKPMEGDFRTRLQNHALWVIANHPESEFAGLPPCSLDRIVDGALYDEAKDLWLQKVSENPCNTAILNNAARFFTIHEREIAEGLYKRLQEMEPGNQEWSESLGRLYSLPTTEVGKCDNCRAALEQFERAFEQASDESRRFYQLGELAAAACRAGEMVKARTYAEKLLEMAQQYKDDWNYGNAVHDGNMVLGLIAVSSGEIDKAKEYLLAAGQTPGSPQLDSFGPDMSLAAELLRLGEKEAVIEYLYLCSRFWDAKHKVSEWERQILCGSIPDFRHY